MKLAKLSLVVALAAACTGTRGSGAGKGSAEVIAVTSSALSTQAAVTGVALTITGSGINPAIATTLAPVGKKFQGIIGGIPAGDHRTFHGDGDDATGKAIYSGDATDVTITKGQEAVVALILQQQEKPDPFHDTAPQLTSVVASSELVAPGDTIGLTATATDPDPDDTLTYTWSATAGTFPGGASGAVATWLAPATDQPLSVTLTVRVRDKVGASAAASFAVSVAPANGKGSASVVASFNDAPSVSAIAMDQNPLTVGTDAHLGVTATDLDGDAIASYAWTTTCPGTFSDAASATPTFTPSAPSGATSCAFTVKVTDTRSGWNTGTLSVATGAGATLATPSLVDTTFQSADAANGAGTVSFRIAAHDPAPNGGVTYAWTPTSGTIDNPTASDVTWTAPACMSGDARVSVTITSTTTHQSTTQVFTITPGTTTGCATTSTCVFDQSSFDDGCVFAP